MAAAAVERGATAPGADGSSTRRRPRGMAAADGDTTAAVALVAAGGGKESAAAVAETTAEAFVPAGAFDREAPRRAAADELLDAATALTASGPSSLASSGFAGRRPRDAPLRAGCSEAVPTAPAATAATPASAPALLMIGPVASYSADSALRRTRPLRRRSAAAAAAAGTACSALDADAASSKTRSAARPRLWPLTDAEDPLRPSSAWTASYTDDKPADAPGLDEEATTAAEEAPASATDDSLLRFAGGCGAAATSASFGNPAAVGCKAAADGSSGAGAGSVTVVALCGTMADAPAREPGARNALAGAADWLATPAVPNGNLPPASCRCRAAAEPLEAAAEPVIRTAASSADVSGACCCCVLRKARSSAGDIVSHGLVCSYATASVRGAALSDDNAAAAASASDDLTR